MANIVLSYGLGVDSTSLLLRWLTDPSSRNFDLSDLLVVTAHTGDEWPETGRLVEEHVLPRLVDAGVRYAQVARASASQTDGIRVLDDTTSPTRLHIAGAYRLSDELTEAGTIPQASGNRRCSMKAKGWPIDSYLEKHAPEATRHAFGFEVGEQGRADRCNDHMPGRLAFGFEVGEQGRADRATQYDTLYRVAEFPLIEWGWDRDACQRFIADVTGVDDWPKSACVYCPFALTSKAGRERSLARYDTLPAAALQALMLERRSLALNPRGGLIAGDRLADLIEARRPLLAVGFGRALEREPHAVYEVRRLWRPRGDNPLKVANANRDLVVLAEGSMAECSRIVRERGPVDIGEDGIERVYLRRREATLPTREHFVVAGPAGARAKCLPSFETWWSALNQTAFAI
jgi:hypothetical protein